MTDFFAWWTADRLTAAFTVVAGIAAVFAWITAARANRRTKILEQSAEESNSIAKNALTVASEANGLAKDANQISSDANTISKRALAVTEDNLEYVWGLEIHYDKEVPVFVNNSAHTAYDVTVQVRTKFRQVAHTFEKEVPPFAKFEFESECIMEEIAEDAASIARLNRGGGVRFFSTPSCRTQVYFIWKSESGAQRSSIVEHTFSH